MRTLSLFLELKTLNVCNSNSCRDVAVLSAGGTTQSLGSSLSWAVFLVRVGHFLSNPSPWFALYTISPLKGTSGLSVCARERVIGAG
ncbi:hypothetical protein Tco_1558892, partial [Tanacetum coccineum]